ncbi:putative ATP-dependent RNA helicase DHR1 [Cladobotryum mycophilum]|uniref:RNA helicase n=1 Tax=Cladobotryum mycophilum TaxID=491253 RepID=A0ABR0SP22_9HYPO
MAKFVPRQRKHKVLAREKAQENARHEVQDTNQDILPDQKKELEEKRARLKEELKQDGAKMNSKKAKRLEKYIDTKLRKDENRELLAKLAETKIDTSLFTSSKSLGQGRETKKQAASRALREHRAGIDLSLDAEEIIFAKRPEVDEEDEEDDAGSAPDEVEQSIVAPVETKTLGQTTAGVEPVGSGLKRPLEVDDEGRPVIQKRQKRGGIKTKAPIVFDEHIPSEESDSSESEDEWNGFSGDEDTNIHSNDKHASASSESGSDNNEEDEEEESSEDDSEDDESSEEEEEISGEQKAQRSSAFKAWAYQQRNEALGFEPTEAGDSIMQMPKPENFVPRAPEQDPLPMELLPTENTSRKVFSVTVVRNPEVQEARLKLPVVSEEQRLMEAIHNHDIVVICGSTGSGKTTQVPQFLYEAGYGSPDSPTPGMIGITQPRRVAAVSMSKRVADELGDHSTAVAYQIRFEGNVDSKTAIKFMTDGVLLREVAQDITLRKYSAIIIDEAHERSVNTDILIGMLSRVIKLRTELAQEDPTVKPLKLIIMSATLRIEDLTMNPTLFSTPPPVIEVEGRQHPVTMHFSRRTHHDYVEEAFRKISRGHKKLPPGGFLVFLTGRNEILELSKKLKTAFGGPRSADGPKVQISATEAPVEVEDIEFGDVDDRAADEMDDLPSEDEEEEDEFKIEDGDDQEVVPLKMQVLPLYSLLPVREQLRVFEEPPEGTRQIILATNVAETSLTIPGTRFVFDCGRSKERNYDRLSGVQSYEIGWISKASANQRSGRAGRTGPGHCYRLYSSAVYERDFPEFGDPELLRMPIEGVVLQLKAMNLQNVVNFPFPTPPDRRSLANAEKLLTYLSAISTSGQVTKVGTTMSVFPLSPRFARILLVGHLHDCLPYTIALVAGLSAAEVYLHENQAIPALTAKEDTAIRTTADVIAEDRQANVRRMFNQVHKNFCFLDDKSDAIKLLQVVGEFAHEPTEQWCESHFVRYKVLKEIQQLRRQITDLLRTNIASFKNIKYQDKLDPPSPKQVSALKQMAAAGFIDQVAIRADLAPNPPEQFRKPRRAIDVPYIPLIPLNGSGSSEDPCVYIHPTSPLAHLSPQECPEYIIYAFLQRATPSGVDSNKKPKARMHSLTDVTAGQLAGLAKGTPLLTYGKPIKEVKAPSLTDGATTRECWVIPYLRAENTPGQGWPLSAQKVKQKKVAGKGWVVE